MKQEGNTLETTIVPVAAEEVVLKVEALSKIYRLGEVGTGTIGHDLNRWWARVRGKEDPFSKVGITNDRTQKAEKGEYVKVLDNINFEVKKGEVLGIIGKNGAGKSTLLKVISQITAPSSGAIKAKGRIASLLEVGTGMNPEMTGKENVYLNGTILGMTKKEIDSKYDEIMDFAGCAKYADTPVKRYSSGMKVRLGFAVAAFLEPEILIVDEVLAVGDAEFQKKAVGKMKDISSGGGRTVLFVSHNMASVQSLCTKGVVLDNGSVSFYGEIEECILKYLKNEEASNHLPNRARLEQLGFIVDLNISSGINGNNIVFSGQEILFSLNIKVPKNLNRGGIGIGINDKYGNRIFTYHSHIELKDKIFFNEKGIEVKIYEERNKLLPGEYDLVISLFDEDGKSMMSWVNEAVLKIDEYDVFKTGKLPNPRYQGLILSNATWTIK